MKKINSFLKMKKNNEKIVMATAYDYPSGKLVQEAKIDIILVGDSLGMVVLGYEDTLSVTMEDMIHHTKATRRGATDTFIIGDMPYKSYHISITETKKNAFRLIQEGKADCVKLEGGSKSRLTAIREIVDCEIPVCGHIGLTPQSVNKFGGFKVQGKSDARYLEILENAKEIEKAGAFMLVLEGIPEKLGKEISESVKIPTIGIGAGRFTDGQVLVYHDILGMADFKPKFVKKYSNLNDTIEKSLKNYIQEVKNSDFPETKHTYFPI